MDPITWLDLVLKRKAFESFVFLFRWYKQASDSPCWVLTLWCEQQAVIPGLRSLSCFDCSWTCNVYRVILTRVIRKINGNDHEKYLYISESLCTQISEDRKGYYCWARSSWRLTLSVIGIEVVPLVPLLRLPCLLMMMVMMMLKMMMMITTSSSTWFQHLLRFFPTASLTRSSTWRGIFKSSSKNLLRQHHQWWFMIFNAHTNSMSISTIPIFEMHRLEATWVRSCRLPRVLKLSRDSAVDNLNCLQVLTHRYSVALSNKSCDNKD